MKAQTLQINKLKTERLLLIPFTIQFCEHVMKGDFSILDKMNLRKGKSWPDNDVIETLPKVISNLSKVKSPTGFESWMIVKKDTMEIIGDAGFKGFNSKLGSIDLGYGIIYEERHKGYAQEAATALVDWALSQEIVKEITANCLVDNVASMNLLKKLTFTAIKNDSEMVYWLLKK